MSTFELCTMLFIKNVPISPVRPAPSKRGSVILEPVSKNAITTPGRAACATASPSKLCFRKTAKLPTTPEPMPKSIVPKKTFLKV